MLLAMFWFLQIYQFVFLLKKKRYFSGKFIFNAMSTMKQCLECGEKIMGRSDKKFCNDQCRNAYNNNLRSDSDQYIKFVNAILRKNRSILAQLNVSGKTKTHRDKLLSKGFNFSFYTNVIINKERKTYYFCYEQGYLPLSDNFLILVQRQNAS